MFNLSKKAENVLFLSAFSAVIVMFIMIFIGKPKDPMEREMEALANDVKLVYKNLPNNGSLSNKALQIASKDKKSFKVTDNNGKLILLLLNSNEKYKIYHVNLHGGVDVTECTYDKETCIYSFSLFKKEDYD